MSGYRRRFPVACDPGTVRTRLLDSEVLRRFVNRQHPVAPPDILVDEVAESSICRWSIDLRSLPSLGLASIEFAIRVAGQQLTADLEDEGGASAHLDATLMLESATPGTVLAVEGLLEVRGFRGVPMPDRAAARLVLTPIIKELVEEIER